ncbi:endonuclease/exonuclease/phosphatase family protein [Haloarculaceae archaeon H-GB11]|nr:endonuclease/exonuclease/phosphatase family protein [Haloarculaceae archaeon H-GB11]
MRVLSWNVQGAFPFYTPIERIDDQVQYLDETADCPDIIALNEVNRFRRDHWLDALRDLGYTEIVHTLDWAAELGESDIPPHQDFHHVNGNLTAVHESFRGTTLTRKQPSIREGPWEDADLKDWDTNVPEKILHATIEIDDWTLDIWNIRAIPGSMHGEEKIKILENTYERILKGSQPPCLLTGDFNSPDKELADGTVIPWRYEEEGETAEMWVAAELNILRGLEEMGMRDVFRAQHGYGDLDMLTVSHATQTDDPFLFHQRTSRKALRPFDCVRDTASQGVSLRSGWVRL